MASELPVLQKCCFCLPLRSYFKLVANVSVILILTSEVYYTAVMARVYGHTILIKHLVAQVFLLIFITMDLMFCITFLTSGHKKSISLLRSYYTYCIVLRVLSTLASIGLLASLSYTLHYVWRISANDTWTLITLYCFGFFGITVLQFYVIILFRSEIMKLRNNGDFTMDAECTITCKDVAEEKGTEKLVNGHLKVCKI